MPYYFRVEDSLLLPKSSSPRHCSIDRLSTNNFFSALRSFVLSVSSEHALLSISIGGCKVQRISRESSHCSRPLLQRLRISQLPSISFSFSFFCALYFVLQKQLSAAIIMSRDFTEQSPFDFYLMHAAL